MNNPIPDEKVAAIQEALFKGRKIEAIKVYRDCTSVGLAEAKTEVERIEAQLRANSPDKFSTAGKGCLSVLAVCMAAVLAALWLAGR